MYKSTDFWYISTKTHTKESKLFAPMLAITRLMFLFWGSSLYTYIYIYIYIYICVCIYISFCIPTIFSYSASMDLPSDGAEWGNNVIYWIIWMAYATPFSQEKCEREINEMSAIAMIAMRIGGMVRRGNRACTQIHTTTRTRSQAPDMRNLMDDIPYSFRRCCLQTFDVEISATNITCQSAHLCYPYSTGTRAHKTRMHVLTGGYQR